MGNLDVLFGCLIHNSCDSRIDGIFQYFCVFELYNTKPQED